MDNKKIKILNLILPIISICAVLVFWSVAALIEDNVFILPTLSQTVESLLALFLDKGFYLAVLTTFIRSFLGFLISFIIAFVLAYFSVKKDWIKKLVQPLISIMRALPTIAIVLLLLLWTTSQIAPIVVTALVVLPTSFNNMYSAFSGVDKNVLEASEVDGATKLNVFYKIEFPLIAPDFYRAVGSGISLNFKLMVAAEVIAQTADSLGFLLNTSKAYFETPTMMALVIVSVLVGVLIESIFILISKKVDDWR